MEPLSAGLAAGAITGAASLLGNLMKTKAEQEARRQQLMMSGAKEALDMGQSALQKQQAQEQSALGDIITAYRSTLGGL